MVNHLLSCSLQSEDVKKRAAMHKEGYSDSVRSPGRQRTLTVPPQLPYILSDAGPSSYTPSFAGPSSVSGQPGVISLNSPTTSHSQLPHNSPTTSHSQLPHIIPQLRYQPYPLPEAFTYSRSSMPLSATSSFDSDSLHPSESASQISYHGHPSLYSRPPSQLGRRRSSHVHHNVPGELVVPIWSAARTRLFEHRLLRLTASAGFPLSWVENPEWQAIREEFIPGAPHISRKVLTK